MSTDTPKLDLPDSETVAQGLRNAVEALYTPRFAVMDGAQFDDVETEFSEAGITARSLFRDGGDPGLRRDGPWLIPLIDKDIRAEIEAMAVAQPCAVFWSCTTDGEAAIHHHLRTINEVLIPNERQPAQPGEQPRYERVLFRHWDPNVLGSIMRILNQGQLARLLGPTSGLALYTPDYDGLRYVPRPGDLPDAPPGPLRFEPEQMDRLKEVMRHSSRLRIARFLKKHPPPHFTGLDDEFFWGATLASAESADELGIRTERGRARWAFAMVLSDGKAAEQAEIRDYIRDGGDTPDNRVKALIQHAADAMRASGSAGGGVA